MDDLSPISISNLPESQTTAKNQDYVPLVHFSDSYQTGMQTVKVHPDAFNAYDNKTSKLNARNYQDAIDEIVNLMSIGQTFNVPLSPNPNAHEVIVHTANVDNGG
jgi:hypothetical protein